MPKTCDFHKAMVQPIIGVLIRPMQAEDLLPIVDVHLKGFPEFFLTFLGADFLKLLYQEILCDTGGLVLVADLDGRVVGFVAGVMNQSSFYHRLVANCKWDFARASMRAILTRPTIVPRLWRALRPSSNAQALLADACLMSVAVRPESSGYGIGRMLVKAFRDEFFVRGAHAVCLATDRDHNERTNRFYQELGFRIGRSFITPEGRAMNEYIIFRGQINDHAPSIPILFPSSSGRRRT